MKFFKKFVLFPLFLLALLPMSLIIGPMLFFGVSSGNLKIEVVKQ